MRNTGLLSILTASVVETNYKLRFFSENSSALINYTIDVTGDNIINISYNSKACPTATIGIGYTIPDRCSVELYIKNASNYSSIRVSDGFDLYQTINGTDYAIQRFYYDDVTRDDSCKVYITAFDVISKAKQSSDFTEDVSARTLKWRIIHELLPDIVGTYNRQYFADYEIDGDHAEGLANYSTKIVPYFNKPNDKGYMSMIAKSLASNAKCKLDNNGNAILRFTGFEKPDSDDDIPIISMENASQWLRAKKPYKYKRVKFRNRKKIDGKRYSFAQTGNTGTKNTYKFGLSPFLDSQCMTSENLTYARQHIADSLAGHYVCFNIASLPAVPIFEAGDWIRVYDNDDAGYVYLCIAEINVVNGTMTLSCGDISSGTIYSGGNSNATNTVVQPSSVNNVVDEVADETSEAINTFADTKVVKHSQSYLYNTALSDSVSESEKLEKITATHLQADQKLDVLNKSIVQADPIDNGDGTYTYTFLMQTGGEIKVDGSAWDFMVASSDNRATWSHYNVNTISVPVSITANRNDLFGIMIPTFTYMTGSAGNWRESWEYVRKTWTAENVRTANRGLYYPVDENTIATYGGSYDVTTSLIGQSVDLYLQGDDIVLQDSSVYSGNFRIGTLTITGVASDTPLSTGGYHVTGTLVVDDCHIKTGSSSYSWADDGDTITISLYLKLIGHGNHIAGDMPNLQETITSDSGGSVTILSQDYLKHTDGTINKLASGKAYKWYKQLLENGKYNVNSDNDVDVELDHYLISGYGNTVVDDTTNPTSVDIIGSANNVEDCKDKSEIIIIGSSNDITQFPSVSGVKMDGIFVGNSGTGLMWYKDSNTVKYYEDYVESSLGDTKYTLSGTQSGGTAIITLTGTDGQVTTATVTVPTATSDLTNDSGFITNTVNNLTNYYLKTETYTQTEINNLISQALSGAFVVVDSLPTASASTMNKIYLVPKTSGSGSNLKDEYITINNNGTYSWELIGDTAVDLTGYVKSIVVNGGTYTVASGTTTITLPNYYTQSQIDTMIADFVESSTLERVEYVQTTPSTYENDTLYVIDDSSDTHVFATIATTGMLSDAIEDSTHRTVTDAEKSSWNGKADASSVYTKTQTDTLLSAKADAGNVYTKSEADDLLDDKVDKVTGKGLSTNDFTDALQTKLNGIASGAEVNVQADWNETDNTSDSYIQNKPSNIVSDASYVHTDNNYTTAEKNKLQGISSGAEVNVQSDWNQSDNTADDFIKNKPSIPTALSELTDDSTHRLVSDAEKSTWNGKQNALTFDSTPTDGSTNPVTSDGIYDALSGKADSTDLADYMTKVDPTGSGSLSINRTENTTVGRNSVALGSNNEASGIASIAIGAGNTVTGNQARVIGANNTVGSSSNFVIGGSNTATGSRSNRFIIGTNNSITGNVGSDAIVIGKYNSMSGSAPDNILIGNSLVGGSKWNQINMGYLNADNSDAIFTIGNGYEREGGVVTRRNALEVLDTGELVLGANPTGSMDAVPKGYLESKFIMISETDYNALTSYESNATYYVY